MNRAYSVLQVKAINDGERLIEGIASTPKPDRVGDIVRPMGAKFALPMPLLWQHKHDKPVGRVEFASPTENGIPFKAYIESTDEPGALKERLDEAWQSLKLRLVTAVSIGFAPIKYAFMENGGIDYLEWEWFELSLVTIPANADATISAIKSVDQEFRAAEGVPDPVIPTSPQPGAATGKTVRVVKLADPARDRAKPFVINSIKPVRSTK